MVGGHVLCEVQPSAGHEAGVGWDPLHARAIVQQRVDVLNCTSSDSSFLQATIIKLEARFAIYLLRTQ